MSTLTPTEPRLETATASHLQDVIVQTAREVEWYQHAERFADIDHIMGAVAARQLVTVTGDSHLTPIYRLRNPGLEREKPPFLLPNSRAALAAVGRLWRQEVVERGVDAPDLRLAVTSLVRTEAMQKDLVNSGALAAPDSTHCVGAAFDLDASGYYRIDLDNGPVPIVSPKRDQAGMRKIGEWLTDRYGNSTQPMVIGDSADFDSRVITSLLVVAQELHEGDYLNRIVEFPDAGNQCLHFCPNPEVPVEEWQSLAQDVNTTAWMG